MLPNARIAVRHIHEEVEFDSLKTKVAGFRILVTHHDLSWAVYAVLLEDDEN